MQSIPDLMSLDIETLHQKAPSAAVLTIGATLFVDGEEQPEKRLSLVIDVNDAMQYGLSDVDTMLWHISQGTDHLRALGLFHDQPVIRTEEALLQLANWIESCQASYPDAQLVTRDHDFDLAILADKYEKLGIPIPWKYWASKSHRTREDDLRWMQNLLGLEVSLPYTKFTKVSHNALQDAVSQGEYLCLLYKSVIEAVTSTK